MPDFSALRSMVNQFLTDTCTINHAGDVAFDPDSVTYPDDTGDEVYSGPCRFSPYRLASQIEVGEAPISEARMAVTLPWSVTGIEIEHLVTVTASGDPHLVGRVYRVIDVQGESDAAYRRLYVEDILTSDEGSGS